MLALEDHLQAEFLGAVVKARAAAADRLQQAALLIEAQGAKVTP